MVARSVHETCSHMQHLNSASEKNVVKIKKLAEATFQHFCFKSFVSCALFRHYTRVCVLCTLLATFKSAQIRNVFSKKVVQTQLQYTQPFLRVIQAKQTQKHTHTRTHTHTYIYIYRPIHAYPHRYIQEFMISGPSPPRPL